MRRPVFRCPTTGRDIDPGIEDTEATPSAGPSIRFAALHVRCAHCGEHHEIKIGENALHEAA
jgi:hypothetical protein